MEVTATAIRKTVLTETYNDVKLMLYEIAWKFKNRYGGDFEEIIAEVNTLYIQAYDSFNPKKKTKITTWMWNKIWYGLLDLYQDNRKRQSLFTQIEMEEEEEGEPYDVYSNELTQTSFHLYDVMESLSEDGQAIVQMLFDAPVEVRQLVLTSNPQNSGFVKPINIKAALRTHLHENLKWTSRRIRESFKEIEMVLND